MHRVVVRQPNAAALLRNPKAAENEFRLLQHLHARGLAAPQPLWLGEAGNPFLQPCLVIAYIDGEMDFAPANVENCVRQLAAELARIHSVDLTAGDLSFLPRRQGCSETLQAQPGSQFDLDTTTANHALQTAQPPAGSVSLLHGDFWPGNVLWRAGRVAAVIDWEDACLGDPLYDLAMARLDIAWIYGWEAMQAFTRSYLAQNGQDAASLPYWDLCAALRLARLVGHDLEGWAAYFEPYGRGDITPASIQRCFQAFVDQAHFNLKSSSPGID